MIAPDDTPQTDGERWHIAYPRQMGNIMYKPSESTICNCEDGQHGVYKTTADICNELNSLEQRLRDAEARAEEADLLVRQLADALGEIVNCDFTYYDGAVTLAGGEIHWADIRHARNVLAEAERLRQ